jgi:serine/threonine protein kinase
MTQLVVTLWYRAPELLLGQKVYDTAVDLWSVGCIFGEITQGTPMFGGRGEIDQINKVCKHFRWRTRRDQYRAADIVSRSANGVDLHVAWSAE